MAIDKALRDVARKDSRAYGLVPVWQQGVPRYPNFSVDQLTDEGYRKNSIVSACISMIATSAPEAVLRVYKPTRRGKVEVPNHWLIRLLQRPNPHLSAYELWEWTHTFLNTSGNCYWELVRAGDNPNGPVVEVYPLRPDRMKIIPDAKEFIAGYEYVVNGQSIFFESWEVIHFKFPDPLDDYYGLSPIKRVARELGIDNEATDFTATFFENAAVPFGLLTTDQPLQDDEADRIATRWWQRFRGKRKHKPAVLGKGTTYQQLGLNFRDMEFEALRSFTETRLCAAFGVDPVLLPSWVGIRHGGKYSNYSEAKRHLWDETIIPALRRIESKITSQLLANEGLIARFDLSGVHALQEDVNEKYNRVIAAYNGGLIRLNEGRTEIGFDPVEGGDRFVFEMQRSASPAPDPADDSGDNAAETDNAVNGYPDDQGDNGQKDLFLKTLAADKEQFADRILRLQDQVIPKFTRDLQAYFKRQKQNVLSILDGSKTIDPAEYQRINREILGLANDWYDDLAALTLEQIMKILVAGGSIAAELVGREFDGTSPEVVAFLESYVPKFTQNVNAITQEDLQAVMIKAQLAGWGIARLKDEIRTLFNSYTDYRAEMIARSESVRSSNAGAHAAFKAADVTRVEWLATEDDRTCPFCMEMDGKVVGIDQVFFKVGDKLTVKDENGQQQSLKITYEDVKYPPLHPNCRCTILPVVE
ncbi:phage portal protein [Effusibacillus pohliae]|uniref:phage portal protein n=1 Tax=Effusibacillus pohliae TaxID=232270 RepID=UPI00036FEB0B|nr:phage portal protein [Effusibacillus pohliae]